MKKLFLSGMILLFGFLLEGCTTSTTTTSLVSTTTPTFGEGYIDFSDLHITVVSDQLSMPEVDYYVYYYGDSCSHCLDLKPTLLPIVESLTEDTFYFVRVFTIHDVAAGAGVTKTPTLIHVVDGVVVDIYEGNTAIISVLNTLS
jgi:thiol-disulfide isomerase/thioredoxin